jgi:hypothetical protein
MIYLGSLWIRPLDYILCPLGSDLPLYIELGQVHGSLGELSLWSMCTEV